ncbi:hypothetical protein IMG5_161110 [Ichthyophthirius multifiliis]|uniref:C2 domain-containing protein n=1 Tax=Ichthyophthirius multifiliis TaxID=5932 RepID=G0R012_ICHMU|nr:hypothetical protein IMG5_161110 [Ichthyophthirius multifiliis]EGR29195.1 hypothetical protein IMG5_161110 [Ichthyophthirius multifiliis]|eukprot:XP_004030431.1 hypothetical protein IMG5_161110 [Ichthyophthirius multifiliis]
MPFKWFHLYGIPLSERPNNFDQIIAGRVKQIEGSAYFGRVLLSLSLSPNENAQSEVQPLAVYKEPPLLKYVLRVDTYELQSQFDCGDYIIIEISLNGKVLRSNACQRKKLKNENKTDKQKSNNEQIIIVNQYEWKESKIKTKEDLLIDLTYDTEQHPDLIISLYSTQVIKKIVQKDKEQRLAYLRVKLNSPDLENEYPKWYTLKPIKYSSFSEVHSHVLLNLELKTEQIAKQKSRHDIKRKIKVQYIFKAYIYGAYDLCPKEFQESIECEVYLQLGAYQKPILKGKKGKNVIWNIKLQEEMQLDEKLEFSSNIILSFANLQAKGILGSDYLADKSIGQCIIRASNCEIKLNKNSEIESLDVLPEYQFYHIIKNGISNGRILACFQLIRKEQQTIKYMNNENIGKILDDNQFYLTQIQLPVIGIRNLPIPLKDPVMYFRIAQPDVKFCLQKKQRQEKKAKNEYYYETMIEIIENQVQDNQETTMTNKYYKNPNFCYQIKNKISEPIKIPKDVRFLPQIEIEIREKDLKSNNVRYITMINIIQYIPWVNDRLYYSNVMEYFEFIKSNFSIQNQEDQLFLQKKTKEFNQKKVNFTITDQDIFTENVVNQIENYANESLLKTSSNQNDVNIKTNQILNEINKNTENFNDRENNQNLDENQSDMNIQNENIQIKLDQSQRNSILKNQNNSITQDNDYISIYDRIQIFKNSEFYKAIEFYKVYIFYKKKNYFIIYEENYDYGREIQKQPMQEILEKKIPYKKYELYKIGQTTVKIIILIILKKKLKKPFQYIGIPTQAVLKAHLKIFILSQEQVNQEKTSRRITKKSNENSILSLGTVKNKNIIIIKNIQNSSSKSIQKSVQNSNQCLMKYKIEDDDQNYSFNIFNQSFLNFFKEPYPLKIRVYILRCLNLSAQSQNLQAYHLLAGMNAVCSASSFPKIQVGTGKDEYGRTDLIKLIIDDQNVQKDTLNPQFFKMYQLDAQLPEDWNLIISIVNKGQVLDSLIGEYEIDLEDRIFGISELRKNVAYEIYKQYYTEQLEKNKYNYDHTFNNKKRSYEQKITELSNLIESFNRNLKIPVEYIELKHPQENTCQGTMELFIEPFPTDIARIIPQSNIQKPSPQEFEIRLIVWEVFNIVLPEGKKSINMYVSVSLDKNANINQEEVTKQTDNHNGSENGNGVYNYRMKFPLCIPCIFPRLRIQVFEFSTIGADENLGETVITLKNIIKKLQINGSFELATSKYLLEHPKFPDQYRGDISLSMSIISKQLAESQPVGEAQEDPNENPFLEKPKEGRGINNFLKGSSFDFSGWGLGILKYVKCLAILAVVVCIIIILFIQPGIMVKSK